MSRYKMYAGKELSKLKKDPEVRDCFDGFGHIETEYFGSTYDLLETLGRRDVSNYAGISRKRAPLCPGCTETGWSRHDYGFSDADDLTKQVRTGLDAVRTSALNRSIQNILQDSVRKRGPVRYLPAGGSVNVPRHLTGIPAMRSRRTKMTPSKVVNLCIDASTTWSTSAEDITRAGEYLMEVVQMLQRDGYRIGLYFSDSCKNAGRKDGDRLRFMAVRIKAPEAAMDISTVGWWLTSPAAQRGVGFSWVCSAPDNARVPTPYGIGLVATPSQSTLLAGMTVPGCIPVRLSTLTEMARMGKTPEQCRDWLESQITGA